MIRTQELAENISHLLPHENLPNPRQREKTGPRGNGNRMTCLQRLRHFATHLLIP